MASLAIRPRSNRHHDPPAEFYYRRTLSLTAAISLLYFALQIVTMWVLMWAYALDYWFWITSSKVPSPRLRNIQQVDPR